MNLVGIAHLHCPLCVGSLRTDIIKSTKVDFEPAQLCNAYASRCESDAAFGESLRTQVEEGLLSCERCKVWYPIINFVPLMLIFKTPLHEHFARQHAQHIAKLPGFSSPNGAPKPGEQSIQRTFTEEWAAVADNELTFTYTTEELAKLQSQVWFNSSKEPAGVRRVLDIGCGGYAAEAEALRLNFPKAEVFAVDLNLHLLRNGHRFVQKPSLHIVIASLFHLPFQKSSFDLVFSQGVLHHTYSTHDAFTNVASYNSAGGFLCVWLYAIEDHQVAGGFKGFRERLRYYLLMVGLRPLVSAAPKFIRVAIINAVASYGYLRYKFSRGPRKAGWKYKNAVHATYDYISPRYAHVHAFNEVIEWYESLGYDYNLHSPAKYRQLFGRPIHGIGVLGRRQA